MLDKNTNKLTKKDVDNLSYSQKKAIIDFYCIPNSLRDTVKHFNISNRYILKCLLKEFNIPEHTSKVYFKLREEHIQKTLKEKYGNNITSTLQLSEVKDKIKETSLKKYGQESFTQTEEYRVKSRQTNLERYGVENIMYREDLKNKCLNSQKEHFGGIGFASKEIANKIKAEVRVKFGVDNPMQSSEIKEKIKLDCLNKFGVASYSKTKEFLDKVYATKKNNNTFNTSKSEQLFKTKAEQIFGTNNVIKEYNTKVYEQSNRYPFNCDFYIKSLDLFIELNINFTHGKHPFDRLNKNDIAILNKWKDKANVGHKYYNNAINTWTIRDPLKLKTAKNNNLNYLVFYKEDEALAWLERQKGEKYE